MHSKFCGIPRRDASIPAINVVKLPVEGAPFALRLRYRQFCMQKNKQVNSKCDLVIGPGGAGNQVRNRAFLYLACLVALVLGRHP
jgi:hypothetical protein